MTDKQTIANILAACGIDAQGNVDYAPSDRDADFCVPCFRLAKEWRQSPQAVATQLVSMVSHPLVADCVAVGGYVNISLNRASLVDEVLATWRARSESTRHPANGRTIVIDYSSINIAKPFHIGHLLTTVIGGSLYRIYQHLGFDVVGVNHLGDWGTQFGKLICAYLRWGDDEDIERRGIHALLDLYVRFHAEAESDPSLEDEGRMYFRRIESGDPQALAIFERFRTVTLADVNRTYERLGVVFDSYNGESFYNDKIAPVVDKLRQRGLLVDSQGAKVVDLSDRDMPPALILKNDGASLYATRDLAAAIYRYQTYHFDRNIYVVAYQQNLHFRQLFAVLELLGCEWHRDCVHVPFGMVSLASGTMSTRKGNVVFLADVLDSAVAKARSIIQVKNPDLADPDAAADAVGIGAVIFGALSTSRIKDVVFELDSALDFDGETGPYLQYTHARACGILAKTTKVADEGQLDCSLLTDQASWELVRLLARFDETVRAAADKYEPSMVSRLLLDIAKAFNKFYLANRIKGESPDLAHSRRALVEASVNALRLGLHLILLRAPQQM